jgi:hypothetical protein
MVTVYMKHVDARVREVFSHILGSCPNDAAVGFYTKLTDTSQYLVVNTIPINAAGPLAQVDRDIVIVVLLGRSGGVRINADDLAEFAALHYESQRQKQAPAIDPDLNRAENRSVEDEIREHQDLEHRCTPTSIELDAGTRLLHLPS